MSYDGLELEVGQERYYLFILRFSPIQLSLLFHSFSSEITSKDPIDLEPAVEQQRYYLFSFRCSQIKSLSFSQLWNFLSRNR